MFANALARRNQSVSLERALAEVQELKARLEEENVYLRKEIDTAVRSGSGIVGESDAIKRVLVQAQQVAPTDAAVLLLGETGTGKELLARTVHMMSPRQGRTMVKVNCAALAPTLIEAELFGRNGEHTRVPWPRQTGPVRGGRRLDDLPGRDRGIPLELQTKLLRVLEQGEFERLGSTRTIRVDVRVIAATNRDVAAMVRQGTFREDLYYRLNVFPIHCLHYERASRTFRCSYGPSLASSPRRRARPSSRFPSELMESLVRYAWSGNVRELRNIIERATIVSAGPALHVELPSPPDQQPSTAMTLEAVERRHITAVLEDARWRIRGEGGAAQRLGLKPSTLEFRMRKLGITR